MKEKIMKRIKEHYKFLENKGYTVLMIASHGSMNYNLYVEEDDYVSDIDTKAIILPTLDELIKDSKPVSKVYDDEYEAHIEVKDIRLMTELWSKQNMAYLEFFYAQYYYINPEYKDMISPLLEMRDEIVGMHKVRLIKSISGMSKEKLKALEHPYPSIKDKIDEYGYDGKQLHHIIRLNDFMRRYFVCGESYAQALWYEDGMIKDYMIGIKKSKLPLEQARTLATEKDAETKQMANNLISNHEKDFEFNNETYKKIKNIIYDIIQQNIKDKIINSLVDKKMFVQLMTDYKSLHKKTEAVDKALHALDKDFGGFHLATAFELIDSLLKICMNDKYDDIDYFIYEHDFGKGDGAIYDENGNRLKFETFEDLYDIIRM